MSKKNKESGKFQLKLTRTQIEKLAGIITQFKEVNDFTITEDHSSGIGPGITVSFDLFEPEDTKVDITDVSTW